ncbi:hypothetical protein B0H17DRAFT_104077 [Mycena rosella]|uniref:Uncharacterized protein n=1 Tax=Mycena rosella TaxID=1033263 RepID=A0AAD7AXE1_MYCRO|nr:hypothetical protein B0H17DRAFT_104077 [Mycena rosella]
MNHTAWAFAPCVNLAVLRFDFHAYFQEQEGGTEEVPDERPSHFLHLQRVLLAALAANRPPSLVSVALHNIIAIPNDLYGDNDAKRFLRCLTRLRLFALGTLPKKSSAPMSRSGTSGSKCSRTSCTKPRASPRSSWTATPPRRVILAQLPLQPCGAGRGRRGLRRAARRHAHAPRARQMQRLRPRGAAILRAPVASRSAAL